MPTTTHTPGPWLALTHPKWSEIEIRAGDALIAVLPPGESMNDAALIAAAPELLERLIETTEALRRAIERSLPPSKVAIAEQSPHLIDARATIAKATGVAS
jgi:hypothetical protein